MSKVTRLTGGQGEEPHRPGLHLRDIPGEADKPPDSVGQSLRAARLRRGDELIRISQALRIRREYLEAIEADRADKLPGRTYAIGFLRAYAGYLGLDGPGLVSRFKNETAGQAEGSPQVGPAPAPERFRWNMGWVVLVLLLGGLVVYAVDQLSSPTPPVQQPPQRASASTAKADRATTERLSIGRSAAARAALPAPRDVQQTLPAGQVFGANNADVRVVLRARA